MIVGCDTTFGSTSATDLAGVVGWVRINQSEHPSAFQPHWDAGFKSIVLFGGPYNGGGVKALNPTTWATNALNWYVANTNPSNSPIIEVLNEPAGGWFWDTNKDSSVAGNQANADAYAILLKTTWTTFHNHYGTSAPLILASVDGGQSGGSSWGSRWWNSTAVAGGVHGFVDGVTVHPYGGSSGQNGGANGNRTSVTNAHTLTGKPVYVTELGWPTAQGQPSTGDSQQWSEAQQATNITNFGAWANSTGYVAGYVNFNYRDFGSNNFYGVSRTNGGAKPSRAALKAVSQAYDTGVTPPPDTGVTIQVNPSNAAQFQIVSVPTGTQLVHLGYAQAVDGTGLTFPGQGVDPGSSGSGLTAPFTLPINLTPPADHPAVQAIAVDSATYSGGTPTGNDIGPWTSFVLTTPASSGTVPTATTDAASSVTASSAVLNGHADAHGVSGAQFHFNLAPSVNGVRGAATQLPSPEALVGDVAATLAYVTEQHGTANNSLTATVASTNANGFTSGRFMLAIVEAKGVAQTQTTITPPTTNGTWVAPTGNDFQFTNAGNGAHRGAIFYRFATVAEVSENWTFSQQGAAIVHTVRVLAFDGVNTSTPLETQDAGTGSKVKWQANAASATTAPVPTGIGNSGELRVSGGIYCNDTTTVAFNAQTPSITHLTDVTVGSSGTGCTTFVGYQGLTSTGNTQSTTATLTDSSGGAADTSATFTLVLAPAAAGTTNKAITWTATGLAPGAYQYQTSVTAGGLSNLGSWVSFSIAGVPVLTGLGVSGVTDTTADVAAHIDPLGASTTWRVEVSTDDGVTWTTAIPDSAPFTTPVDI